MHTNVTIVLVGVALVRDVVSKAEKANAGFKAVSVEAEIEGDVAQADVNLLKGTEAKRVEDKL